MDEIDVKKLRAKKRMLQRKKRRRKRLIALCVIFVVLVFILCFVVKNITMKLTPMSDITTLTIEPDGSIIYEDIEELSENYDIDELMDFAKEQVKDYNAPEGESVNIVKTDASENRAYIKTEYSSHAAYTDFSGYESFYGTVKEASEAGYKIDSVLADGIKLNGDEKVFIIRQIVRVASSENILYVGNEWGDSIVPSDGFVDIPAINEKYSAPALTYIIFGNTPAEPKTSEEE